MISIQELPEQLTLLGSLAPTLADAASDRRIPDVQRCILIALLSIHDRLVTTNYELARLADPDSVRVEHTVDLRRDSDTDHRDTVDRVASIEAVPSTPRKDSAPIPGDVKAPLA